jgi:predicted RNase H-like HicB family nuclease
MSYQKNPSDPPENWLWHFANAHFAKAQPLYAQQGHICEDPMDASESSDLPTIAEALELFRDQTLAGRLASIEKNLAQLSDAVEHLSSITSGWVPIHTLADESLRLNSAILATVISIEGGFLCEFPECNLSASGETQFEAIENLKDMIESAYTVLSEVPEKELGLVPRRQLEILSQLISIRD